MTVVCYQIFCGYMLHLISEIKFEPQPLNAKWPKLDLAGSIQICNFSLCLTVSQ